jgi:membrane-associated phospholipid phosphatase
MGALGAISVALTFLVRRDGPLYGEVGATRWMRDNTPSIVELFADLIDPALTDVAAPLVFVAIALMVWWRWGRYPVFLLGLAGVFTGLTRVGDLVHRPRPTSTVEWSDYSVGSGGYPSGHAVFAVLVLGTVAVLSRRYSTSRGSKWILRSMQILVGLTLWSRVSRLEHWPLDVVGGGLMAGVGLVGIVWLHPRLLAFASARPYLRHLLRLH